jgi:hypothetical protein
MSRTLPLLVERGVREVTVVCGSLHLPRVRFYFGGVYPRHGIRCSYVRTRQAPTPPALGRELVAVALMRRQRRRAIAELGGLHVAGQVQPDAVGDAPGREMPEGA